MTIRLVLADDHPIVLTGLEHLFACEADCEVTASCGSGKEVLDAVRRQKPDVVILDSRMPATNSLEVIRALIRDRSSPRVVLHAESSEEELIREAVRLGVRGVFLKEMPPGMLVQCVRRVYGGEYWLEWRSASQVLEELLKQEQGARDLARLLTPREQEILHLLCRGLRNKEIAKNVSISESTVKVHLRHIYEKLKVNGRLALLRYAEDKGLIRLIRS
ncbi:MAG TPA: response regulator transcription factor [Thermoanaerobaculia bacterium]|nr:response regulator transcription factor [Thermoanaerobaculia bacterium]